MRILAIAVVALGFGAVKADESSDLDRLFTSWQKTQSDTKSLIVEFRLEKRNLILGGRQASDGSLRCIRDEQGGLHALYELRKTKPSPLKQERWSGLLTDRKIYVLFPAKKEALRFDLADGNLSRFLEKHFNPVVLLLDKQRAKAECEIHLEKQDQWYKYLLLTPKEAKRNRWNPPFLNVRIALMREDSAQVPKDMPRGIRYTDDRQQAYTIDIKAWRLNPVESPNREEFIRPEIRPGWKVHNWPFGS